MSIKIAFVKMHGLGNDFVIIEEKSLPASISKTDLALAIADRRLGVGCDQLIIYENKSENIVQMGIYNPDGSGAKACGNASRCLSRLIYDDSGRRTIILNIEGRNVLCEYINPNEIKVNMGIASFDEQWMPSSDRLWELAQKYMIEPKEMSCVDVGNPHVVIFSKLSEPDRAIIGKNFQESNVFPEGVNVNFAMIEDDKIRLKVWERGTGFTYACGSGAVASFAAANKLGFTGDKSEVIFELGSLKMHKTNNEIGMAEIYMTGPASYIFRGEYIYG